MKKRRVIFSPEAQTDLLELYDWISDQADPVTAIKYIERLEVFCSNLSDGSERGTLRDDIRPNLRVIGFERRVSIAFSVATDVVTVLGFFSGGRNWQTGLG